MEAFRFHLKNKKITWPSGGDEWSSRPIDVDNNSGDGAENTKIRNKEPSLEALAIVLLGDDSN